MPANLRLSSRLVGVLSGHRRFWRGCAGIFVAELAVIVLANVGAPLWAALSIAIAAGTLVVVADWGREVRRTIVVDRTRLEHEGAFAAAEQAWDEVMAGPHPIPSFLTFHGPA